MKSVPDPSCAHPPGRARAWIPLAGLLPLLVHAPAGARADALDDLLAGDAHADSVRQDVETARGIGVQGVPFFVFNRRLAVSGAQPVEVLAQALDQAIEA